MWLELPLQSAAPTDVLCSAHWGREFSSRPCQRIGSIQTMTRTETCSYRLHVQRLSVFQLAKRRNRSSPCIGELRRGKETAYHIAPQHSISENADPDLLAFTCGQWGMTHRIVQSMLESKRFVASGEQDDEHRAEYRRALTPYISLFNSASFGSTTRYLCDQIPSEFPSPATSSKVSPFPNAFSNASSCLSSSRIHVASPKRARKSAMCRTASTPVECCSCVHKQTISN